MSMEQLEQLSVPNLFQSQWSTVKVTKIMVTKKNNSYVVWDSLLSQTGIIYMQTEVALNAGGR